MGMRDSNHCSHLRDTADGFHSPPRLHCRRADSLAHGRNLQPRGGLPIWANWLPQPIARISSSPSNMVNEGLTIATYIAGLFVKSMEEDMIGL
jgi:hypothetical protein